MTDESSQPIVVSAATAPAAVSEGFTTAVTAGLAFAADHFMHDGAMMAAVVAASGVVATVLWGIYQRVKRHKVLQKLANAVSDAVAVVK